MFELQLRAKYIGNLLGFTEKQEDWVLGCNLCISCFVCGDSYFLTCATFSIFFPYDCLKIFIFGIFG